MYELCEQFQPKEKKERKAQNCFPNELFGFSELDPQEDFCIIPRAVMGMEVLFPPTNSQGARVLMRQVSGLDLNPLFVWSGLGA